ncbi:unnamed protein product [Blepharisma stoltei]|uniref:RRM domain-containing protein n=1 Tax=Blepharisma stoltei TaxID=1481888 RepID=A0AAU9KBB8_9CILI|nr:unnamed protein product [Blepharisma stoltei]
MLRYARCLGRRFFRDYSSASDIEEPIPQPKADKKGVVVRHLPKGYSQQSLSTHISALFNSNDVSIFPNIKGEPAYAVVKFDDPVRFEQALSLNKRPFLGRKIYLQTIEEFVAASPEIVGGFDSRKVIAYHLNPLMNEEEIYKMFSQVGDIMGMHLPRDYNTPPMMIDGGINIPESLKKFHLRTEKETDFSGYTSRHTLNDVRVYIKDEISNLQYRLGEENISEEVKAVFEDMYDLWDYVRAVKDSLHTNASSMEKEIEEKFNNLLGKKASASLRNELLDILMMMKLDSKQFIDYWFITRGYVHITYATRKQAERAIYFGAVGRPEGRNLEVAFDRGVPGYFYCDKLVGEAFFQEFAKKKDTDRKEYQRVYISQEHHETAFKDIFYKKLAQQTHYYGSDEERDPVLQKIVDSYEDSNEIREAIDHIYPYGANERQEKKKFNSPVTDLASSDDEILKLPEETEHFEDENRGRLNDPNHPYTKRLMDKYLIDSRSLPKTTDEINMMRTSPDFFSPRKIPPKSVWANLSEKEEFGTRMVDIEQFFHEAIPSELKLSPELLTKARFSDYPEVRYVYKRPFNYSDMPAPKISSDSAGRSAVKEEMMSFIRSLTSDKATTEEAPQPRNLFGKEETNLFNKETCKQLSIHTDSDEEEKFQAWVKTNVVHDTNTKNIRVQIKQNYMEIEGFLAEIAAKSDMAYTKQYIYEGDDVEEHIKDVKEKFPSLDVTYAKDKFDQNIVLLRYEKKFKLNLDEIEKMHRKYFQQAKNNPDELEIDEEDEELVQKLNNLEMNTVDICNDLMSQIYEKACREHMASQYNMEDLEKWGSIVKDLKEQAEKVDAETFLEFLRNR